MSDLISRSALIERLEKSLIHIDGTTKRTTEIIIQEINNAPTIEAKPIVHGEWKFEMSTVFPVYRCSECNCATALGQTKFCPNCGADMRKKV